MKEGDKLYCVTRRDLKPGYQAVQSCHAYVEFALTFPRVTKKWNAVSNYMGLLSVENEAALFDLYAEAIGKGIKAVPFYEPDVGYQMTALCLEPSDGTVDLTSSLPLALQEYKKRSKQSAP